MYLQNNLFVTIHQVKTQVPSTIILTNLQFDVCLMFTIFSHNIQNIAVLNIIRLNTTTTFIDINIDVE